MIEDEAQARSWLQSCPGYDDRAETRLLEFIELLRAENNRQNLVARTSLTQVWRRHIADSAQLLRLVPRETSTWLDLGTGAGFPGLVVAMLRPETQVTLVESRSRRSAWLQHAVDALALHNVRVWRGRLERLQTEASAAISARAFAPLAQLVALAARFSTSETVWLLPKGRSARDELAALSGWRHTFHVEQSLTDAGSGVIVGRLLGHKEPRG